MAVSLDWFFQGREQMGPVSFSRLTAILVYGIIVMLTVHAGRDVPFAPAAFLIGNWGGALILLFLFSARFGKLEIGWQPALWWTIFRENLPVGIGMFLGQLTVNLPPLVIGLLVTTAAVGQFTAAARVAFGVLILDRLFNTLFLPMLSRHLAEGRGAAEKLLSVSLKGVVQVMSLVGVAGVLLAPLFINILFGAQYEDAVPLLQLLMPYVFLTVVNSVFVCAVLAAGRTREYLLVTARSGLVLTVAVLILAHFFGTAGAVLGMVIGEFAAVQFSTGAAARVIACGDLRWYICTSVLLLGIVLLPAIISFLGVTAGIAAGAVVVLVGWLLSGGLSRQDVAYIRGGLL
jgi:O-antigen/teichoic acid export membrane protein